MTITDSETEKWIEKVVSETFDELLVEISSKSKLHPSEQVNRDGALAEYSNMKIYDFVNSYHAYCKLCDQHFYSRSVASDINSFFQKHINTSYHRQIREVYPPSDETPIFTWGEKFHWGRCNLCEFSNISSYIIDTEFDLKKLMKLHICFWDRESRETNERMLRKFNLLKKYCGLSVFQEKFIKTVCKKKVCLICRIYISWSEEKAKCHLSSDIHYQNFCGFLHVRFNFLPKDVLNGFNLEVVTRWIITHELSLFPKYTIFDELKLCLFQSNNENNPYEEEKGNYCFSPKLIQIFSKIGAANDFMHKNKCLLCNKTFDLKHLNSKFHLSKVSSFDKSSFDSPEKFLIFCRNREKRLHILQKYKRLESGLDNLHISPKKDIKHTPEPTFSREKYFMTLIKNKMNLVGFIFTMLKNGEAFCQICDHYLPADSTATHLNNPYHISQELKWKELKRHLTNERFIEPFQKFKNLILCLVCGAVFDPNSFFSHIKGGTHSWRFEWYINQEETTPIFSSFSIREDFLCFCIHCNTSMNKGVSISPLKTMVQNIRRHWPCPYVKEKKADLSNELNIIFKINKTDISSDLNLTQEMSIVPCSTSGQPFEETDIKIHNVECAKNSVDFEKVEKTVENIVNIFEKNIINYVLFRSAALCGFNNSKISRTKKKFKKNLKKEMFSTEDLIGNGSQSSLDRSATKQTSEKEWEGRHIKILQNELRAKKTDNDNNIDKEMEFFKIEKQNHENAHEVLVIKGLPKNKKHCEFIYEKCGSLGKIRYLFFSRRSAIVAFADHGVAEIAAKNADLFKDLGLTLKISTRKENVLKNEKNVGKIAELDENLVPLLSNPQSVINFAVNLFVEAVKGSRCLLERKREELVCGTILGAVAGSFPQGVCYPFGSRLSGLTLNNSDLDVFLDCGGMYEGFKNTTPSSERKLVNKVAGLLRKKEEITEIVVVDRARVPIVSFLHKPTLLHCDLSFKNGLSVQNTLLIKFMVSLDWRVSPLILFLKHWMKLHKLHGPPFFSSYAIAMLVIYYLEQLECPVLPTIESLQNAHVGRRTTIGGWDCSINLNRSNIPISQNKDTFPKLLAELFEFYSEFDYKANVISPLTGKPLPREIFSSYQAKKLPMSYKRHILNIPTPIENLVNNKIHICIMDPYDLSHILTKSFTSEGLQIFIQLCKASAEILKNAIAVSEKF